MLAPLPQPDPQQQPPQQPPMAGATPGIGGTQPAVQPTQPLASPVPPPAKPAAPGKPDPAKYTDAQIMVWEKMGSKPLAKKYGMDTIFQQRIADKRARMAFYTDAVRGGAPLEKISKEDRSSLVQYMKYMGLNPNTQSLKPEYRSGLNVLHVALFGAGNPYGVKSPGAEAARSYSQKGLSDYLFVLNSPDSRAKLLLVPELYYPQNEAPGVLGSYWRALRTHIANFTTDERNFAIQLARAKSAIWSLRPVTGLARATQQLGLTYQLELPDPATDDSDTALRKLLSIQREVEAAYDNSPEAKISAATLPTESSMPPGEAAPPPPPGFVLEPPQ